MTRLKVFVSQPMNGKSHDDILAERTRCVKILADMLGIPCSRIDVVNPIERRIADDDERFNKLGYDLANPPRVWWLGQAIQEMAAADIFVFAEGYIEAKGCVIERHVQSIYFEDTPVLNQRHVQSIYFEDTPVLNLCKYNLIRMKDSLALDKLEDIWDEEHMSPPKPNTIIYEYVYTPSGEEKK